MLSLVDPRWHELAQAYGSAEDVPRVLAALASTTETGAQSELWFALWKMLHQPNEAFSASYAAAPHLVALAARGDVDTCARAVHLVTRIELSRRAPGAATMPPDLLASYAEAIERLPDVVAASAREEWSAEVAQVFAAALLAGKRQPLLADAVLRIGVDE